MHSYATTHFNLLYLYLSDHSQYSKTPELPFGRTWQSVKSVVIASSANYLISDSRCENELNHFGL